MKQYTFLYENLIHNNIHYYNSWKEFNDKKLSQVAYLVKQLTTSDEKFENQISTIAANIDKSNKWTEDQWRDSLQKSDYIYCTYELHDDVIGLVIIQKPSVKTTNAHAIRMLIVDKEYRNIGIATKLLNFLKKKFKRLFIKVIPTNKIALKLYLKFGFKPWIISLISD